MGLDSRRCSGLSGISARSQYRQSRGCSWHHAGSAQYGFAEADLHNLWPALGRINSSRQDLEFGELPGETFRTKTDICPDYERSSGSGAIVEPQDSSKGNFARSIFYMAVFYDLPLMHEPKMLARWHDEDPPSDEEQSRNDEIENHQGTRNPFIDYPAISRLIDIE